MDVDQNYPFADRFPFGDRRQGAIAGGGGGGTQFARPISDLSVSGYAPSSGTDLFAMLDEVAANDSDYIEASAGSSTALFRLTSLTDPGFDTNHTLSFRAADVATGSQDIACDLYCGATFIETVVVTATSSPTTVAVTLNPANVANITDYTNLQALARDTAGAVKGAVRRVYWIELKVGP